jgi:hypothetical protein
MTNCRECEHLNRVYGSKLAKYRAARCAVFYRISTEFAAKQQVDMERAKNDMEEHLLTCPFATKAGRLMLLQESWWSDSHCRLSNQETSEIQRLQTLHIGR